MTKTFDPFTLPESVARRLKSLPPSPLLLLDHEDSPWMHHLKVGTRHLAWLPVLYSGPTEGDEVDLADRLAHHPQLRQGGYAWMPGSGQVRPPLPQKWRYLPHPWSYLARWVLGQVALRGRQVAVVGPASSGLETLAGWLVGQGASLSWCDDHSRHLWSQLRLCDVVLLFPGCATQVEACHLSAGGVFLDFRPTVPAVAGSATEMIVTRYADAASGSLDLLLASLAMGMVAQQETMFELA